MKNTTGAISVLLLIFTSFLGIAMTATAEPDERGIIGRVMIDGFPVIYKLVDESPSDNTRARFPWLTRTYGAGDADTGQSARSVFDKSSAFGPVGHFLDSLDIVGVNRHGVPHKLRHDHRPSRPCLDRPTIVARYSGFHLLHQVVIDKWTFVY